MELQELETKLQNVLAKYGKFKEEDDDVPNFTTEDFEAIRLILYEAVSAMRNGCKALIPSDNFRRLLIKSSMAILDPELRSFIKNHADIKEISYLLANEHSSLNDLIYSTLFEPEEVSKLGLPLGDLQAILKRNFESRTELIKSVRNKYLSAGVIEFCSTFPEMEKLCSTPWKVLNKKMNETNVTEEEKRAVMKCLWGQHTEFRKELCENNFSGELIDELESKGAGYLEQLGRNEHLELKQRYGLTARQLDILDAWSAKNSSYHTANKAAGMEKQLERRRLVDLITKVKANLTLIANECHVQSADLDEFFAILNWNKDLLTKSNVVLPMKYMLDQALRILELRPEDRTERNEDLIASVDDGSALHGLCLGLNKDNWCYKAHSPLLRRPDVCKLTETTESCVIKNFCFFDKNEARKFEQVVLETGLSAAESFAKQYESCFETNLDGNCKSVIILSFRSYPMASFRSEDKRRLNLTPQAERALEDVRDNKTAASFMDNYGSHLLKGVQQLGGVTCHSVEISLPINEAKASVRELAHQVLERGVSEFLFLPNTTKVVNMDCNISGKTLNVPCSFEAKLRGPQIAHPQLYAEIIKHCNLQHSVVIERNVTKSSLYGIWNWIADKMPNMMKQAEFLRNTWLRKANRCETVEIVASELRKTKEENSDELIEEKEKEMESSLEELGRLNLSNTEDEMLLNALRNFFSAVQEYEQLAEKEGLANPWVKYVGKREEFEQFLNKFTQAWNESRHNPSTFQLKSSLNFLREMLNNEKVSNTLERARRLQDAQIKRMLAETSENVSAESQAFNTRLSQVRMGNLVETLKAELQNESCLSDAGSLSTVQWRIGSLLKQALLFDDTSRSFIEIEDLLMKNYGWHNWSFTYKLTADSFLSLVSSIERVISENASDDTMDNKTEVDSKQTIAEPIGSYVDLNETNSNTIVEEKFSEVEELIIDPPADVDQNDRVIKKRFDPQDPSRIERAKQSALRKKKVVLDFLVDIPSEVIYDNETLARRKLMRRLRHRMDLSRSLNETEEQEEDFFGANSSGNNFTSHYKTLCELIDEFDPNVICEIHQLLLESRYTLPLFNPLTGEHYLKLLQEECVSIAPSKPPIRLGDDVTMPRVALISCREPAESQAHEILRSVFHVNTLHANDLAEDTLIDQALTIDIGIGHVEQKKVKSTSQHSSDDRAGEGPLAVLLVHVTGDFTSAMDFVKEFADVLIVEDVPSNSSASSFCSFISETGTDSLKRIVEVLRWKPTSGKFSTLGLDANLKKHGFAHLSVEAPSGDKLFNGMISALHATTINAQRNRKPLHTLDLFGAGVTYPVKGVVPFDIEQLLEENLKNVAQTRSKFLLQQNFRVQYKHEEKKIENRNNESEMKKAESEIEECEKQRKSDAKQVEELPLLKFFLKLLENPHASVRVMALRKFSQGVSTRTEAELQQLQKEIDEYYKLVIGRVSENKSEKEAQANKEKYVKAKQKYQDAMLHAEHLWRELSHMYVADQTKYRHLPRLAAQHLLDGFSIELLDGDANLLNLKWINAVFTNLHQLLDVEKRRIFVLSVMGVQSSGKSTLLNTMFGIKMRTSVGQCTRGINMQLLPTEGRKEYDYVLVLDTEGTRSPDFYGMEGNEKRDNQMATLSILLADATIIVNPGENDAATKEILPIVLMAYQGSKLAEDNGGRLSSMMFFVYNRIDTTQKEKLTNIIQTLAQSLLDAFKTVREMGGCIASTQETSNCLFRHFTLDTSNSSSSDVRILGQNRKSYEPPTNVPEPRYGEALVEFREHIHCRVTQARDGGVTWKRRSLIHLSNYIADIWQCICSADFTLRFAHVVERTTFGHLDAEYQRYERDLASVYRVKFDELHKSMLKERGGVNIGDSAATNKLSEDFQRRLQKAVGDTIFNLNSNVEQILCQKGREKWKISYEQRWDLFKRKQSDYWSRQIRHCFDNIFLFDNTVAQLKSEMRQRIRDTFSGFTPDKLASLSDTLTNEYYRIMTDFIKEADAKYPPLNVKEEINRIYRENPTIKGHKIKVLDNSAAEQMCTEIFNQIRSCSSANKDIQVLHQQNWWDKVKLKFKSYMPNPSKGKSHPSEDYMLFLNIHTDIETLLEGVERYDVGLVSTVIDNTDSILKKTICGLIDYCPRENAHVYARLALTHYMENIQARWEECNAIPARFKEQKNMDEMLRYFQMVLNGVKMIKLFSAHLQNKFEDLSTVFEAEMVCLIAQRVKEQEWLYEIKWTQNYMDRYLLELIDKKQTSKIIHFVQNPKELFTVVMQRLIAQIAKDLLTTGKGWREFKDRVKKAVNLATEKALSSKTNRAEAFVNELHARLIDTLKADVLPKTIELDLGQEYTALDSEKDDEFRVAVESRLLEIIDTQYEPSDKEKLSLTVSDLVIKLLRVENQPGAMPRCEAHCPWCRATCNKKAGHDPQKEKHDAIHQPSGLGGTRFVRTKTLCSDICSSYEDTRILLWGEVEFLFVDWCKQFPDWQKPHPTQEWPLREYIFYHYHEDFAKHYGYLPCSDIPESYNRDLSIIRETLEHGPIEF